MKKRRLKKSRIIELLLIIIFIISIINISIWFIDNKKNEKIVKDIKKAVKIDLKKEEYDIDFKSLKNKNSDTVAYFIMKNPSIEYPIVKHSDNDYYLTHNFNKEYNKAGWLFASTINKVDDTDKNLIIYGHNMKNGSMFGSLKNVLTNEWYNSNERDIVLITDKHVYKYKVFSVYRIKVETYYITTNFESDNDYNKFLQTIKRRSIFDFNEDLYSSDKILTLSTCSGDNYRVVVHAKLIDKK